MIIIVMRCSGALDIGRRKESLTRRVFFAYHAIELYCVIKKGWIKWHGVFDVW